MIVATKAWSYDAAYDVAAARPQGRIRVLSAILKNLILASGARQAHDNTYGRADEQQKARC